VRDYQGHHCTTATATTTAADTGDDTTTAAANASAATTTATTAATASGDYELNTSRALHCHCCSCIVHLRQVHSCRRIIS
jgi:hypothetical protein